MKIVLDDFALEPVRGHSTDAGLDLRTPVSFWLHPGEHKTIDTGVHVQIPDGFVGLITSKSKLMAEGVTSRGTIDAGYTGSIKAVLYNHGKEGRKFEVGEKITQLVILPCIIPELEYVDALEGTERGDGGFGSTGR